MRSIDERRRGRPPCRHPPREACGWISPWRRRIVGCSRTRARSDASRPAIPTSRRGELGVDPTLIPRVQGAFASRRLRPARAGPSPTIRMAPSFFGGLAEGGFPPEMSNVPSTPLGATFEDEEDEAERFGGKAARAVQTDASNDATPRGPPPVLGYSELVVQYKWNTSGAGRPKRQGSRCQQLHNIVALIDDWDSGRIKNQGGEYTCAHFGRHLKLSWSQLTPGVHC